MLEMYKGVANSPETTITNNINESDTLIYVLDETRVPEELPNLMVLGTGVSAETIKVISIDGNALTVERGFQGVPRSWNAGTVIARNFTEYDYNALIENIKTLKTKTDTNADDIGDLENLDTTEKANLVLALNETYQELAAHKADNVSQVGGVHGLIYEEGTWTPTLAGLNIPGVQTYSRQEGSYIRINNIVTVFFGITLTARDLSTSGTLIVTGLPFKPLGVGQNNGVSFGRITGTNIADPYTSIVAHASGNPQFTLFKVGQNTFASLFIADIADDFQILGSLTYKI